MKWTIDKPVAPGWYWARMLSESKKRQYVVRFVDDERIYVAGSMSVFDVGYFEQWAGPIEEPEDVIERAQDGTKPGGG